MHDSLHRTLILRFSSVGDIVLSSLLLRVFHQRFPECRIDFLVKEEYADLVRNNPHVTEVLTFPTEGTFATLKQLRHEIRRRNYDLIVDIHDNLRSRYICLGARRAVRYRKRRIARFLLVRFKWNLYRRLGGAPSIALRYLEPLHEFNVQDDGNGLDIFVTDNDLRTVAHLLETQGLSLQSTLIGICPFAKHKNKEWLQQRFLETVAQLSAQLNAHIVIFGWGNHEVVRAQEMTETLDGLTQGRRSLNLAGKLSLTQTAAMMDRCSLILSNDSGLMHLAAARKRKLVAVFGPTVEEFGFFPFGTQSRVIEDTGLSCRPCTPIGLPECPLGHFRCMRDIEPERVTRAAQELLET